MLLLRHSCFVWRKIGTVCSEKSFFRVFEVFNKQVLNIESDIAGEAEVQDAAMVRT